MALIAHYKLDGNANDLSGISHGINNGATWVTGKLGQAASFDGTATPYIRFPNAIINNLQDFTFSLWCYCLSYCPIADNRFIFSCENTDVGNYILFGPQATTFIFYVAGAVYFFISTLPLNVWALFTITRKGNSLSLYKDGIFIASQTCLTTTLTANGATILGQEQDGPLGGFNTNQCWHGYVDDLKIYNHALSLKEVKELYKAKILHYKFDQLEEYTTNLVPYPLDNWDGTNFVFPAYNYDATGTATITRTNITGNPINSPYVLRYSTGTTGYKYWAILCPASGVTADGTYTFSYYSRIVSGATSSNLNNQQLWRNNTTGDKVCTGLNPVHTNEWKRQVATGPILAGETLSFFVIHSGTLTGGIVIDFCGFQLEMKDHATPFIVGTRADVITDSSGYGNNGIVIPSGHKWQQSIVKVGTGCPYFRGINYSDFIRVSLTGLWSGDTSVSWWEYNPNATDKIATSLGAYGSSGVYMHKGNQINIYTGTNELGSVAWAVTPNVWRHHALTYNRTTLSFSHYINGTNIGSTVLTAPIIPSIQEVYIGTYMGETTTWATNGYIDDYRIYNSCLTQSDITELYQTRASLDTNGTLSAQSLQEVGIPYKPSLIDYSTWILGQYQTAQTGLTISGSFGNHIIKKPNPVGVDDIVYGIVNGGINTTTGYTTSLFNVDFTKKYRYSIWIKRENINNGNLVFGVHGYNTARVLRLDTGVTEAAGYAFLSSTLPLNEWLLYTTYVWPYATTNTSTITGTIYRTDGSVYGLANNEYKWANGITNTQLAWYLQTSTDSNCYQYSYRPRVDLCDGTEPTIGDLLACRENPVLTTTAYRSDFSYNVDNWYAGSTTLTVSNKVLVSTATGIDPILLHQGFNFNGSDYCWIYIRFRQTIGALGNQFWILDNEATEYYKAVNYVSKGLGVWEEFKINMSVVDFGNWIGRTITEVRIDVPNNAPSLPCTMEISHIIIDDGTYCGMKKGLQSNGNYVASEFSEVGPTQGLLAWYDFENIPDMPDGSSPTYLRTLFSASDITTVWTTNCWHNAVGTYNCTLSLSGNYLRGDFTGTNGIMRLATDPRNKRFRVKIMSSVTGAIRLNNDDAANRSFSVVAGAWNILEIVCDGTGAGCCDIESSITGYLLVAEAYVGDGTYTSKLKDISGNNNHSVVYGASTADGISGEALAFNGSSSSCITPNMFISGRTALSVSMWVKFNSSMIGVDTRFFWGNGYCFMLFKDVVNTLIFYCRTTLNGNTAITVPSGTAVANTWYHLVAIYNGSSAVMYVNKVAGTSTAISGELYPNGETDIRLGQYSNNNNSLSGIIDEVRIYNRALSVKEINTLYNLKPANMYIEDNGIVNISQIVES